VHSKGLGIATIVFTVLELITFGATFPIGVFFLALANASYSVSDGTDTATYTIPAGPRATISWIGLCIVMGVVWPVVSLILAIVQMVFTDKLMATGSARIFASSPGVTVVTLQSVPAQPAYGQPVPGAPYWPQQPHAHPHQQYAAGGYPAPYPQQHGGHAPAPTSFYPTSPGYHYPMPPPQPGYPYAPQQAPNPYGQYPQQPMQQQPMQQQPMQQQPMPQEQQPATVTVVTTKQPA
jgi:hypothetical protein